MIQSWYHPVFLYSFLLAVNACGGSEADDEPVIIQMLDGVHQAFGNDENTRDVVRDFSLPGDLNGFGSILLEIDLECPDGGCDPWDRFAKMRIIKGQDTLEIARYITPYGVGCSMTFDVSDYRSILTGEVTVHSFIDTWVNPGWLVSSRLIYEKGESEFSDIAVIKTYQNDQLVYGDPNNPPDIPASDFENTGNRVKVRVLNTGHGQGNTNNAAEFYQVTHTLRANSSTRSHELWRDNCELTPCSPQNGNWTYPRAGWCPGASVIPMDFDITSDLIEGTNSIQYVLADYENICRPDNPACTGETCAIGDDCNFNNQGHTEPHYKIEIQFIIYSE